MESLKNVVLRELKSPTYAQYNLKKNPFYHIERDTPDNIQKNLPRLIGRDQQIADIGRYFADLISEQIGSITILGSGGIGKTHFLLYLFFQIKEAMKISSELDKKFEIKLLMGADEFDGFLGGYSPTRKKLLLFIDEADQCWQRHPNQLRKLYEQPDTLVIGTWKKSNWDSAKKSTLGAPKSKCFMLTKLTNTDCEEILRDRLFSQLIDKNKSLPFDELAISKLAENCEGIPYSLLSDAERVLQEGISNQKKIIDVSVVETILATKHRDIREVVGTEELLSNALRRTLLSVYDYTNSWRRKAGAETIAKELGRKRSAIVISFKKLQAGGYLEAQRLGRRVLYGLTIKGQKLCEFLREQENGVNKTQQ
ncbi:hypothetical protein HZC07_01275 [Candidatus Micrarchaeota archaeon]|nr:hypothetical protein [Candidatus Micrarchaeota archaeon]